MKISDRYAIAVKSSNLKSRPETRMSDSDVLGAYGLVGKAEPLSTGLARLLAGDNSAVRGILEVMTGMAVGKAHRLRLDVTQIECADISRMVLAWSRHGTCTHCGGRGYELIPGTPALSDNACPRCHGTGKRPFDAEFPLDRLELARWVLAEVERDLAKAGPLAMAKLAQRMDSGL